MGLSRAPQRLARPIQQHVANMADSPSWVQAFRANIDTVLNAVATEDAKRIVQFAQTLFSCRVAAIRKEAVSLQQAAGADEAVRVPPERRASR